MAKLWARLVIEGWPHIFVTHQNMTKTLADGRIQRVGLQLEGIVLGADVSFYQATLEGDAYTVKIADPLPSRSTTASLATEPTQFASLTAELSATATTATVDNTADFASSGVVHIGTEAITYSGKTATTFTGLGRGAWGTIARKHVVPTGEGTYYPAVEDLPRAMLGRRAYLYLYTDGPSAIAAGTPDPTDTDIFWRGVVSTERSYRAGEWRIGIGPITSAFEQSIGGDIEDPVPIRGIYYPPTAPFVLSLRRLGGATPTSAITADVFGKSWSATSTASERAICVIGFFETQRDFLDELQTQLDAKIAGWSLDADSALTFEETSDGFRLRYRTGGTNAHYIAIGNIFPISRLDTLQEMSGRYWTDATGADATTMGIAETYFINWTSPVPRAAIGRDPARAEARLYADPADLTGFDERRIYIGGDVVPTTDMLIEIESEELSDDTSGRTISERVLAVNAVDRYLTLILSRPWSFELLTLGPGTRVRLGRLLGTGDLSDFRTALLDLVADVHSSGGAPLLSSADWASSATEIAAASAGLRIAQGRRFVARESKALWDIIKEELKLLGMYPTFDSQGRIVFKRMRVLASTDPTTATLTAQNTVGDFPGFEPNPYGIMGKVVYLTGYNSKTDEHEGRTYVGRNLRAYSLSPKAGTIEVAPLSEPLSIPPDGAVMDAREVVEASSRWLGIFGAPHFFLSLQGDFSLRTIRPGDAVAVTSKLLPNAAGTLGLTARPGLVAGVKIDLTSGVVTLRLLMTQLRIAGYAPGYRVTSSALVSGTTYDITLDWTDYGAEAPGDVLGVGDAIEVWQRNTRTPSSVTGTVDAVTSGSAVVRCTLSGTIPSGSLAFGYGSATAVQASQEVYCFIAGSDRRVDFTSGTVRGRDFAP